MAWTAEWVSTATGPQRVHRHTVNPVTDEAPFSQALRSSELARSRPISHLQLPSRALHSLARHGILNIGVLITWSRSELRREVIGLGDKSLDTIESSLATQGLSLSLEPAAGRPQSFTPLTNARHIRNHNTWTNSEDLTN
ncbi:DNA-directed RNA polymerase subunit alpha C-terminal domain-containing protein [Paenarthrobacter sp. AB444]|uniref:DNA-directed RNA polymerase subunit alpha C-terminal domain-containing protein n=1 Tax=Paenarthrobacter sp. AB444 TaxID=3025681 RepID=UPI003FCFDA64